MIYIYILYYLDIFRLFSSRFSKSVVRVIYVVEKNVSPDWLHHLKTCTVHSSLASLQQAELQKRLNSSLYQIFRVGLPLTQEGFCVMTKKFARATDVFKYTLSSGHHVHKSTKAFSKCVSLKFKRYCIPLMAPCFQTGLLISN